MLHASPEWGIFLGSISTLWGMQADEFPVVHRQLPEASLRRSAPRYIDSLIAQSAVGMPFIMAMLADVVM